MILKNWKKSNKNPLKYGSPNVAILSELNIYSLDKIYGQCENLIFTICK